MNVSEVSSLVLQNLEDLHFFGSGSRIKFLSFGNIISRESSENPGSLRGANKPAIIAFLHYKDHITWKTNHFSPSMSLDGWTLMLLVTFSELDFIFVLGLVVVESTISRKNKIKQKTSYNKHLGLTGLAHSWSRPSLKTSDVVAVIAIAWSGTWKIRGETVSKKQLLGMASMFETGSTYIQSRIWTLDTVIWSVGANRQISVLENWMGSRGSDWLDEWRWRQSCK